MRALCLAALLGAACNSSDIDPMEQQPKYREYAENTFFEDTRAMRTPPPGTVAREARIEQRLEDGTRDGEYLRELPLPVTAGLLQRGRRRFEIQCATCHGLVGDGKSLVAANMALKPPPSLLSRAELADGKIFQVITKGYGLMPSYADDIPDAAERWAVVAYLRALQLSQRAPLDSAPADERQKLEGR